MFAFLKKSNNLWQFQKLDKQKIDSSIAEWNEKHSLISPHCSICLPFANQQDSVSKMEPREDDGANSNSKLPVNSEILIPEVCFMKKSKNKSDASEMLIKKIDCLLQCKMCKLTVHQSKNLKKKFINSA